MTRQRPARWQKSVEEEVSPQVHDALKAEPQKKKHARVLRAATHLIQGKPKATSLAHNDFNVAVLCEDCVCIIDCKCQPGAPTGRTKNGWRSKWTGALKSRRDKLVQICCWSKLTKCWFSLIWTKFKKEMATLHLESMVVPHVTVKIYAQPTIWCWAETENFKLVHGPLCRNRQACKMLWFAAASGNAEVWWFWFL